ncbi:MAG: hypothetical protein LH473_05035, partial [Chitinophagales bacterium]|nr:hypothetical protein [Chitinophagales bacterium]
MKNIFTALLISLAFHSFSQNTFIKYTLCGNNTCNIKESHINTDGNAVVLRVYVKSSDNHAYLTEVDGSGNIINNILISEPVNNEIIFHSFIQTSDGGYLLTGNTHPGLPDGNACLLKITSDWQFEWAQAYKGDALNAGEFGINVFETANNKYQFFQNSVNAVLISQLDNSGNVEWSKKIDSLNLHEALPTNENEVLLNSSVETSSGFHEIRILKIDKEGNVVWSRKMQSLLSYTGHVISQLSDGNFIFDALPDSANISNLVLLKIDPDGNLLWGKEYKESNGGVAIGLMYFNEIPGSGIIQTAIEAFESGIYNLQLTIEGEVISANKILLKQHRVNYLTQMPDNGFIISGKRAVPGEKFSGFIIKTDALGITACENETANFTSVTNNNLVSEELIMKSYDAINS